MFNRWISFISTFLTLIPISIGGVGGLYLSMPLILFWFFVSFYIEPKVKVSSSYLLIFISFVLLLLLVSLVTIIHSQNYYDLVKMTSFGLVVFISCSILVYCHKINFKVDADKIILSNIYIIGTINAFVAIVVLAVPTLRSIIYSVVDTSPLNEIHLEIGMRSSGLFYFGGSIMSMFHCLIIYIALIYITNFKRKASLIDYLFILINIGGIFVSGRLGFVFLIMMLFTLISLPGKIVLIKKKIIVNIFILATVFSFILLVQYYEHFKRLLDWGFEFFTNYINNGEIGSHSTDVLQTMYRFPNDLLIGNGIFSQIKLATDSGYVLLIWYFGIISILVYGALFFIHTFYVLVSKNEYFKKIYLLALIIIIVGNFKDIYLFASNGITQIYMIALIICVSSKKVYMKNE